MTPTTDLPHEDKAQDFIASLVDTPPRAQLGLEPGDLQGAVRQARHALEQGDIMTGLYQFANLVILDSSEVDHHIGLAEAALMAEMYEMAMSTACAAMVLDPKRAEGYLLCGRAALAMGEIEAAIEDLTDAVTFSDGPLRDYARSWLVRAQASAPTS